MAKRIAYLDLNAENFHANVYLNGLRGELADRGYVVSGVHGLEAAASKEWAKKNDVPYFDDLDEMDANTDVYMVLAPSNPETHLELCEMAFQYGKPTYVDKTFAPDLETARTIFAMADKYGTVAQTTSALRYTGVQQVAKELGDLQHMVTWGPGGSFDEYAIHPVELAISCMGSEATSLMRRGTGDFSQLLLNFTGGRTAVVNVTCRMSAPYAASLVGGGKHVMMEVDLSRLFLDTMIAILDFFEAGKPNIPREESLMIRAILDASMDPAALRGFVDLPSVAAEE